MVSEFASGQTGFSLLDLQEERQCSMCRASNRLTQLLMCFWKGKEFCTNLFGNQGHYPIVYYKYVQFDSTALQTSKVSAVLIIGVKICNF
jgi:hypothetical protein